MLNDYSLPEVPAFITVHLGAPNEAADNVTVAFPEYIKGAVSLAVDPTGGKEYICAVTYAFLTKALFRINERYYRKQGYSFDITSDPLFDVYYEYGSAVYDNVNELVDGVFNEYISREEENVPINAEVCYSGERCRGMSLEGAYVMGANGSTCREILRYYFGENIKIADNAPVSGLSNLYLLEYPMVRGNRGANVSGLQISLNKVAANYPTVPYIENVNGVYGEETVQSVREFQRIFDLKVTGAVGKDTYYMLLYVLDSIYRLSYLVYLEQQFADIPTALRSVLDYGDVGNQVKLLQYYLLFVSSFESRVPPLQVVGVYGEKTFQAVTAFQRIFGFEPDGRVTEEMWSVLRRVYGGLYSSLPPGAFSETALPYGGNILILGSDGREVRYLQLYLKEVAGIYPQFPEVTVNGIFDEQTEVAVKAFQRLFGIKETGVVTSTTWNILSEIYNAIKAGE